MNYQDGPEQFPRDFLWGVATASFQVEGAACEDGRGESIWDRFCRTPGAVAHGHTGDVSVDQYHRFPEDIAIMRSIGVRSYRFSIAWPRIQPAGAGTFNRAGIDYYKRLCVSLREAGVEATATLYHWDLPQALQETGGWPQRDTAFRFAEYVDICARELGPYVDRWITLNEPWCSAILGYVEGAHAPGIRDQTQGWAAAHHLLLGHGLAVGALRAETPAKPVGISLNLDTPRPATRREENVLAADRWMDLRTRMFLDPLLGRPYPSRHFEAYPSHRPPTIAADDADLIAQPIDFLGLNYYYEPVVGHDPNHPEGFTEVPSHHSTTAMGWPVVPRGLHRHLHWVSGHCDRRFPLFITENGCAVDDVLSEEGTRCHDPARIDYLRTHLRAAADALADGIDLRGYFCWSLIDNFEWAYGYTKRFGLVYADYVNQRRVVKDSAYFLREVISGGEPV
ncbi:MAG: beta-glucosidase [Spirochaetaceae bacterium]|nr:MAG: beta-glucosidase [Spirochaetaceae bacterium]